MVTLARRGMTEDLYIFILVMSRVNGPLVSSLLLNKIKDSDSPDGVTITDVKRGRDPVIGYVFDQVIRHNPTDVDDPRFECEDDNYIRIEVDTPESIRFQKLDWLEEQIKSVIKESDDSVGVYFSYLISDSEFKLSNIMKIYKDEGETLIEDDESDDFSDLQNMGPFFSKYIYPDESTSLGEEYPDLVAKLFLLFG
jgi:hypothetical protein